MSDLQGKSQKAIRLGTHGEDYGSWVSNPVFYMVGGLTDLATLLAVLSFAVFHIFVPGILFVIIVAGLLALLGWITWIRRRMPLMAAGSWSGCIRRSCPTWIMTAKEHCWM